MKTLSFEWDVTKNAINRRKNGLSFETAKEVFYDSNAVLFDDPDHFIIETTFLEVPFLIIGMAKSKKICIVSHCFMRSDNTVCIISARAATKNERKIYQEGW